MVFELDLTYLHTSNRSKIIAGEAACALLGGIINTVWGGLAQILLAFTFWTTFLISATIVFLHICNIYEKLRAKVGPLLKQVEICYIGLCLILYAISTILSFVSWGGSNILAYIELMLFTIDGYLYYKKPKITEVPTNLPE